MSKSKNAESTQGADKAPKCPITREQFTANAKPVLVVIDGKQIVANVKLFESGSLGWYAGEKIVVVIDGVPVKVQVGLNLTIVGSKELPK